MDNTEANTSPFDAALTGNVAEAHVALQAEFNVDARNAAAYRGQEKIHWFRQTALGEWSECQREKPTRGNAA